MIVHRNDWPTLFKQAAVCTLARRQFDRCAAHNSLSSRQEERILDDALPKKQQMCSRRLEASQRRTVAYTLLQLPIIGLCGREADSAV